MAGWADVSIRASRAGFKNIAQIRFQINCIGWEYEDYSE